MSYREAVEYKKKEFKSAEQEREEYRKEMEDRLYAFACRMNDEPVENNSDNNK